MNFKKTAYTALTDINKSDGQTPLGRLGVACKTLNESISDTIDIELAISLSLQDLLIYYKDPAGATTAQTSFDELITDIDALFDEYLAVKGYSNDQIAKIECSSGYDYCQVSRQITDGVSHFYCGDDLFATFEKDTQQSVNMYPTGHDFKTIKHAVSILESDIINWSVRGKLQSMDIADITTRAVALDWSTDARGNSANILSAVIDSKTHLDPETKNDLRTAASYGPDGLTRYITTLASKSVELMNIEDDDEQFEFWNSLSIPLQTFASGLLMGIVSALADLSWLALLFLPKAFAVLFIIGWKVFEGIVNFFFSKATDDARFTITTGANPGFSFVVNRGITKDADGTISAAIQALGSTSITISSDSDPSIIIATLLGDEDNSIAWEEHISANFDILSMITKIPHPTLQDRCLLVIPMSVDGPITIYNSIVLGDYKADYSRPDYTPSPFGSYGFLFPFSGNLGDNASSLCQRCYSPVTFDRWDIVISSFTGVEDDRKNSLSNMYCTGRLVSGLVLWFCKHFLHVLGNNVIDYDLNNPGSLPSEAWIDFFGPWGVTEDNPLFDIRSLIRKCITTICDMCHNGADDTDVTNHQDINFSYHYSLLDDVLLNIQHVFDGLYDIQVADDDRYALFIEGWAGYGFFAFTKADILNAGFYQAHWTDVSFPTISGSFFFMTADAAEDVVDAFRYYGSELHYKPVNVLSVANYGVPGMVPEFAISLPTMTMRAVLHGLFIDGIIAVTAVIATVAVYKAYRKFQKYRSRKYLDVVAAQYKAIDTINSPTATEAEKTAAFNAYDTKRRVYNRFATLTGGPSFDQYGSSEIDYDNSQVESDLKSIIKLISG